VGSRLRTLLFVVLLGTSNVALGQSTLEIGIQQHFTAAREAEKRGDLATAEKEYQAVLKLSPDLAEVSSNLGLVYYLQRKDAEAIKAFQEALKRKPALVSANLFLGMSYTRTNQYDKAIAMLDSQIAGVQKPSDRLDLLYQCLDHTFTG
jgi:tetratricopeptide (TPR) repeat protein